MEGVIPHFADILALLYHEGRNVRHLARKSCIPTNSGFLALRDRLARNREEAWRQIQPLRRNAGKAESVAEGQRIFEDWCGLTLDDLVTLYANSGWRGSQYGGNAWLPVANMAVELRNLINADRYDEACQLVERILDSSHNTGKIGHKIKNLDKCLAATSPS